MSTEALLIKLKSHRSFGSDVHILDLSEHRTCTKKKHTQGFEVILQIQTELFRYQTDLVSRSGVIRQICLTGCYLKFIYV